jgi:hypothetical protein
VSLHSGFRFSVFLRIGALGLIQQRVAPRRGGNKCHDEKEIALGTDGGRFRAHPHRDLGTPCSLGGGQTAQEPAYWLDAVIG